jgi:hypothetical protein
MPDARFQSGSLSEKMPINKGQQRPLTRPPQRRPHPASGRPFTSGETFRGSGGVHWGAAASSRRAPLPMFPRLFPHTADAADGSTCGSWNGANEPKPHHGGPSVTPHAETPGLGCTLHAARSYTRRHPPTYGLTSGAAAVSVSQRLSHLAALVWTTFNYPSLSSLKF